MQNEFITIESIDWVVPNDVKESAQLPEDVTVLISEEMFSALDNGESEPHLAENALLAIRVYISEHFGYVISDIDGWNYHLSKIVPDNYLDLTQIKF